MGSGEWLFNFLNLLVQLHKGVAGQELLVGGLVGASFLLLLVKQVLNLIPSLLANKSPEPPPDD